MQLFAENVSFSLSPLVQLIGGSPVLALAGRGDYALFATSFEKVSAEDALSRRIEPGSGWGPGIIGVMAYEDMRHDTYDASKFYRVHEGLLFERCSGKVYIFGSPSSMRQFEPMDVISELGHKPLFEAKGMQLIPEISDAEYIKLAAQGVRDIQLGRYYQINLLRYFSVAEPVTLQWILARLDAVGGEFSALVCDEDIIVASLSPERFVVRDGERGIAACPIKGTVARSLADDEQDQKQAEWLLNSKKDLAELHMIVDLMRNDLYQLSEKGSVKVVNPHKLLTTSRVHHLEAKITSELRHGVTLRELWRHLGPAGSITGAPKVEVMKAIAEYEKRRREYFMGNIFYHSDNGHFDASVLIRTLVVQSDGRGSYAAGSGITLQSDPARELSEIFDKCRVITD